MPRYEEPMVVRYESPDNWISYDPAAIVHELTQAKAAVLSLTAIPFQRSWAEALQEIELKREVAGTSRIEGAEFTDREFEEAVGNTGAEQDLTRSQRQARAAISTYRWIAKVPPDRPISDELIFEIHRRIVTGCDDDHCAPAQLRADDDNVTFGRPRHRGASGGVECRSAFRNFCQAINREFRSHDGLVQALAAHYHFGAIHPFQDGNGRTARALEALLLKRADLKDTLFVAMSNYYYDEKDNYLEYLSKTALDRHDLTQFLKFGLKGIATQSHRLLREIRRHVSKSIYRDVMSEMYGRLRSTRKRALANRQVAILTALLEKDEPVSLEQLRVSLEKVYSPLKADLRAFIRDLNHLTAMKAISVQKREMAPGRPPYEGYLVQARLEWPTEITETEFYQEINRLPQAKTKLLA